MMSQQSFTPYPVVQTSSLPMGSAVSAPPMHGPQEQGATRVSLGKPRTVVVQKSRMAAPAVLGREVLSTPGMAMSSAQSTPVQTPRVVQVIRSSRPLSRASSFASEHSVSFGSVSSLPTVVTTASGGIPHPQVLAGMPVTQSPSRKMMPSLLSSPPQQAQWDPKTGTYTTAAPVQTQKPVKVVVVRKRQAPLFESPTVLEDAQLVPTLPSMLAAPSEPSAPGVDLLSQTQPHLTGCSDASDSTPSTATPTAAAPAQNEVPLVEAPKAQPATGDIDAVHTTADKVAPQGQEADSNVAAQAVAEASDASLPPLPSTTQPRVEFEGAGLGLDKIESEVEDEEAQQYWESLTCRIKSSNSPIDSDSDEEEEAEVTACGEKGEETLQVNASSASNTASLATVEKETCSGSIGGTALAMTSPTKEVNTTDILAKTQQATEKILTVLRRLWSTPGIQKIFLIFLAVFFLTRFRRVSTGGPASLRRAKMKALV